MSALTVDLRTFDVGAEAASPQEFAAQVTRLVRESWESGADIVCLPEYLWMGLERFTGETEERPAMAAISRLFWTELWPDLQNELTCKDKAAILGTAPWAEGEGAPTNRAPIISNGVAHHQEKRSLTPWESSFAAGLDTAIFELQGFRFAVLICFDIEVPEWSVALRGKGIDVLLVPSATESVLGVERVGRCASARAVELGCYVGVCHLVGKTNSVLVDENVGRLAWFTPSQSPFVEAPREIVTPVVEKNFHWLRGVASADLLRRMRALRAETNPALLPAK